MFKIPLGRLLNARFPIQSPVAIAPKEGFFSYPTVLIEYTRDLQSLSGIPQEIRLQPDQAT
ncbi:hypothetical protein LPB72_11830 [Hydrogenophaga crassostreae]|uniref:Uncharacterized protein n=1 Tax=Hydrogenophaga crassostreae TaxID=1763535 RepID=A0A167I096_9BURK|nr:hypothetical protein LPB072_13210 [Hydrogenophaga crassostreae]OAD41962.1 hypothetical protein LPB72_11830 [Hydrogenophaga crassostreae]